MKKVLLLIVGFLASLQVNAQKLTKDYLTGKWESEFHIVDFSIINKSDLKINFYAKGVNQELDIVGYQFNKNDFYLETYYSGNNWSAIAKFTMIDENTMVADFASDAPAKVIYKRRK